MFRKGRKVEAVDKRCPALIRVATVAAVARRQVKVRPIQTSTSPCPSFMNELVFLPPYSLCLKIQNFSSKELSSYLKGLKPFSFPQLLLPYERRALGG